MIDRTRGAIGDNRRGFTLMEILVALSLGATVFVVVLMSVNTLLGAVHTSRSRLQRANMAHAALARIEADLAGLTTLITSPALHGTGGRRQGHAADTFTVTTFAHLPATADQPPGIPAQVSYELMAVERYPGLSLVRRDIPWPGLRRNPEPPPGQVVCHSLAAFAVTYHQIDGRELDYWPPAGNDEPAPLPALITVRLTLMGTEPGHDAGPSYTLTISPPNDHVPPASQ